MNSSLRIEAWSGIWPCSRLAAASLNDTSLTLSEKVEKEFSLVWISGWGMGAFVAGLRAGMSDKSVAAANVSDKAAPAELAVAEGTAFTNLSPTGIIEIP